MSVTLINGDGNPRVLASQDADWYGALTGQTTCIVPINDNLGATIADSNTIEISSGVCITKEGRRVQIDEGDIEEIIIPTGTQGVDTYYIIGFHLYINELGQQVAETFVETMASATDTITETTFKEGSSSIYVSLYRVKRSGLLMDSVTRIIPILRTIAELDNTLGTTDISAIGDGTVTGGISQLNSDLSGKSNVADAGYSLAVSGKTVSLKNKAGTVLNSINTQDTTAQIIVDGWFYSANASIAASQLYHFTISGIAKSGYTIIGLLDFGAENNGGNGESAVTCYRYTVESNTIQFYVKNNLTTTTINVRMRAKVVYFRNVTS